MRLIVRVLLAPLRLIQIRVLGLKFHIKDLLLRVLARSVYADVLDL